MTTNFNAPGREAHAAAARLPGGPASVSLRLTAVAALILSAFACERSVDGDEAVFTIYSPSPPSIMLHDHNLELGKTFAACGIENEIAAVALPESVNAISSKGEREKAFHLPIMTTIDFLPAIERTGPDWHAYDKANADLKFVTSLYDVAFGVLVFDPAIRTPADLKGRRLGAPPRPSAVRVFTEALLRDGWGAAGAIELVDILPPDIPAAIAEGRIDATVWNLMSETAEGFRPMTPGLLSIEGAGWLSVTDEEIRALNDANGFETEAVSVDLALLGGEPRIEARATLLSFRQALAAWDSTPDAAVAAMLTCLAHNGPQSSVLPRSVAAMRRWPGLTDDHIHEAAFEFYRNHGVTPK